MLTRFRPFNIKFMNTLKSNFISHRHIITLINPEDVLVELLKKSNSLPNDKLGDQLFDLIYKNPTKYIPKKYPFKEVADFLVVNDALPTKYQLFISLLDQQDLLDMYSVRNHIGIPMFDTIFQIGLEESISVLGKTTLGKFLSTHYFNSKLDKSIKFPNLSGHIMHVLDFSELFNSVHPDKTFIKGDILKNTSLINVVDKSECVDKQIKLDDGFVCINQEFDKLKTITMTHVPFGKR